MCATYVVCAFVVALLPATAALSLAPLAVLTATVALDSRRTWQVA